MNISWKKLGVIFDPRTVTLPLGCLDFAQAPQALVFDDYIRIYFSTRLRDKDSGKYLSHVAYVDMDKGLSRVLKVAKSPVMGLGKLGCFDEHGIFPISPLRVGDKLFAYTCGWSRRISVSVETGIGLATSEDDGETFTNIGDGPVLGASLNEPMLVGDAFVRYLDDTFYMCYIFGKGWLETDGSEPPARIYKIAQAKSKDGVCWQTEGGRQIIPDRLGESECQALPTVIKWGQRWHMFFCFRQATDFRSNPDRSYRIGYAFSDDLENWTRDDESVRLDSPVGEWDSDMQCYPNVFSANNKVYFLYNGNQFGRYGFGAAELEFYTGG
ncbi:MAG TPA: hypothetical protein DEP46_13935 [Blastocatellia bacterium]|nr:hypothetical protein [Blastocatellia bacterium]